jgi:hypothetical protein
MAISENNSIPLLINDNPTTDESTSDLKKNSSDYRYVGIFGLFLLVMLIVLPFMFGGRDPFVASLIKIMFFAGTLVSIISSIFLKNRLNYSENLKSNKPTFLKTHDGFKKLKFRQLQHEILAFKCRNSFNFSWSIQL